MFTVLVFIPTLLGLASLYFTKQAMRHGVNLDMCRKIAIGNSDNFVIATAGIFLITLILWANYDISAKWVMSAGIQAILWICLRLYVGRPTWGT